ncbi:unnamed protein product, partial [Didymodactylos carnosus]
DTLYNIRNGYWHSPECQQEAVGIPKGVNKKLLVLPASVWECQQEAIGTPGSGN